MLLCNDIDLLHWEPLLFRDASAVAPTLISGTGDLAATVFTLDSGSLADAHVSAGHVITFAGAVEGSFPIVAVDSATQLTLSVLHDGLYPAQGDPVPGPVGTAQDLSFTIRTFSPQRTIVSDLIARCAGVDPADAAGPRIIGGGATRAAALGTLQMIYNALAAASAEPQAFITRAELYERLYRRALRNIEIEIDTDGDGVANLRRSLRTLELRRA